MTPTQQSDGSIDALRDELAAARELDIESIASAIHSIGFECTRCGACCRGTDEHDHTATVFPHEIRSLMGDAYDWRDVARPIPFGIEEGEGETFEWALQTDACGDCVFYDETDETTVCTAYENRPSICRTYPFSVELGPIAPTGSIVEREGIVQAHECEGLGRSISWPDAIELAREVKHRTIKDLEELIAVLEAYSPHDSSPDGVVVHDSEGAKSPDGSLISDEKPGN